MCTFKITNNPNKIWIDDFLAWGGPTVTNSVEIAGVYITHYLLHVTGELTPQPVERDGKYFLLMGEFYNYDASLPSDIYFGIEKYLEYGDDFTAHMDGEFLFIVYDPSKQTIDFFTDPWSTRQVWYRELRGHFYFTTLVNEKNALYALDVCRMPLRRFIDKDEQYRLPHNSHCRYDIKNKSLKIVNDTLHKWNFDQNVNTLEDVEKYFTEAVLKRWYPNCTLFLSGGMDSSSVALCLTDNKRKFNSLSLMLRPFFEDEDVFKKVLSYCKDYINHYNIVNITEGNTRNTEIYNLARDRFNSKVVLMGNGADETFDNYRAKGKSEFKFFPENLTDIFPWKHFYGGQCRDLLDLFETYNIFSGLELRNIFFDKKLVQAWFNVDVNIKNKEHKIFMKKYLRKRQIPISKFPKSGFGKQFYPGPLKNETK